jgi:hypothetical protein
MGYPMDYGRVVNRNGLQGDYGSKHATELNCIRGDLRRLEDDQRDENHLPRYARYAGITEEQAKKVLDAFFDPNLMNRTCAGRAWVDTNGRHDYHGGRGQ